MRTDPTAPEPVEGPTGSLGRLGPPLLRLAAMQGAWPPHIPERVMTAPAADGWETGLAAADALIDEGADLVVVAGGEPPGPALSLLAALLSLEPVAAVGTSAQPGWAALVAEVRQGVRACRAHLADPTGMIDALSADSLAGLSGVVARCAERRTPVLLSGAPDAVAAAVLADRVGPGTTTWLLAGCSAPAGGPAKGLEDLGLTGLLDLALGRPEGADLALGVLLGAVRLARA